MAAGLFRVSPSPHVHTDESTGKLMYGVIIALVPAFLVAVWHFGAGALVVTGTAMASCFAFEYLIQKYILKQEVTVGDGSALVTGILLAFCLPANLPLWMVMTGSLVAIGVGKMTFGGLGNNPFNPALVGRVFLFVSFPVAMTSWPRPGQAWTVVADAVTGATPLGLVKEGIRNGEALDRILPGLPSYGDMLTGNTGGSLGEMAAAAILIGLAYMLLRKIITWHIPVSILGTVAVFTGILWLADPVNHAGPLFHLLTGGLMLGAVFMATDYVTSPMNPAGMIVFGIGIGIITVLIRTFGAYPEGVQFAILIMNAFVPLINKYFKPSGFGKKTEQ